MWIGIHSPELEVVLGVELLLLGGQRKLGRQQGERHGQCERAFHRAGSPPK